MKNMTLQAKNSNRSKTGLTTQWSNRLFIAGLTVLTVLFTGCKDSNEPESFNGDVARPAWSVPADYDVTSSMTAVVKVDLKAMYPSRAADFVLNDNDLLAAFFGETCLGVASPQDGLFFLYIAGPTANANANAVTLRYYSADYKNLFEARDAFPFVNDTNLGTVAEPLIPALQVVKN